MNIFRTHYSLREMCPNTEFFMVRIKIFEHFSRSYFQNTLGKLLLTPGKSMIKIEAHSRPHQTSNMERFVKIVSQNIPS